MNEYTAKIVGQEGGRYYFDVAGVDFGYGESTPIVLKQKDDLVLVKFGGGYYWSGRGETSYGSARMQILKKGKRSTMYGNRHNYNNILEVGNYGNDWRKIQKVLFTLMEDKELSKENSIDLFNKELKKLGSHLYNKHVIIHNTRDIKHYLDLEYKLIFKRKQYQGNKYWICYCEEFGEGACRGQGSTKTEAELDFDNNKNDFIEQLYEENHKIPMPRNKTKVDVVKTFIQYKAWMIVDIEHEIIFTGWWLTRAEAIYDHCKALKNARLKSSDIEEIRKIWKELRKKGHRAIKGTVHCEWKQK